MKATKKAAKGIAATKNPVQKKTAAKKPANPPKCGGVKCGSPKKGEVQYGSLGYIVRKYSLSDVSLIAEDNPMCDALSTVLNQCSRKNFAMRLLSLYEVKPRNGKVHFLAVVEVEAKNGNDWAMNANNLVGFFAGFRNSPVKTWLVELQNDCLKERFFAIVGFVPTDDGGKAGKTAKRVTAKAKPKAKGKRK